MAHPNEKQIAKLRAAWDKAVEKDKPKDALEPLVGLEKLEPREPRWPHRLGDLYRRLGRPKESEAAYERALRVYQQGGFVARAVAMAKTIVAMNPARSAILEEIDPDAARTLRRQSRPQLFLPKAAPVLVPSAPPAPPPGQPARPRPQIAGLPAHKVEAVAMAPKLQQAADQAQDEVRFDDLTEEPSVSVEINVYELDPSLIDEAVAALPTETDDAAEPAVAAAPAAPTAERLSVMTGAGLFADVPREVVVELARAASLEEHAPATIVFRRGDPADSLYVIVEGSAHVDLQDVGVNVELSEGQVFGEACLLASGTRGANVVGVTPLTVLRIAKADLDRVVGTEPSLGNVLFDLLVKRLVANALQTLPLFAAFDLATRVELARLFEVRRAASGVMLKQVGKRSDGLYIPLAGELSAERPGRTWTVPLGQVFGQQSLLTSAASNHTVTVVHEAVVLRLPATRFGSFAAQYAPALASLADLAVDEDTL